MGQAGCPWASASAAWQSHWAARRWTCPHAYALFVLLLPGLLLLWYNLIPLLHRGTEFRIEADGSVTVRAGDSWLALLEYEFSSATADGTTIEFMPPQGAGTLVLPQQRVFSREYDVRLSSKPALNSFVGACAAGDFNSTR